LVMGQVFVRELVMPHPMGVSSKGRDLCRHCKLRVIRYTTRSLCRVCGVTYEIKRLYEPVFAPRTPGPGQHGIAPGAEHTMTPTTALPGTWEKVEVMIERMASGQPLHHPRDSRWE
jgi:hypothetical protein